MSLHDYTSKEVLNKVLLDSSGDAVNAFSHTTQEALNAALDATNNRLNVSLAGGTISGDVTIAGDLTVSGDSVSNVSEIVNGDMTITSSASNHPVLTLENSNNDDSPAFLVFKKSNSGSAEDGDEVGQFQYKGFNDASTPELTTYADNYMSAEDVSNGEEDGSMTFRTMKAGTLTSTLVLRSGNVGVGASPNGHHHLHITKPSGTLSATGFPSILNIEGNTYTTSQNITRIRSINIDPMTINGSHDVADAMSVYIGGPPTISTSGGGTKIAHALYVASGNNYFGGNVGIGVTPESTWLSTRTALQVGGSGVIFGATSAGANGNMSIGQNVYQHSGGSLKRIAEDEASMYQQTAGTHTFSSTVSSTANSNITFTDVFKLDINSRISLSNNDGGNTGNTIFGKSAWNHPGDNDASDYNTIVGELAMGTGTIDAASNNTGIGYKALTSLTTGDSNTAIGSNSGFTLSTGIRNTFIGNSAGYTTVDVDNAVFIGYNAGSGDNITDAADGTIGIGVSALAALTSGAANVAVGFESGKSITTGTRNTAVGYASMDGLDVAEDNVAVGWYALGGASTSSNNQRNVAVGVGSMSGTNAGAGQNVAVGYGTLDANMTSAADDNTGVGYIALSGVTSGANNTAIGSGAGQVTTTGGANTVVGYQALNGDTDGDGADNTALGHKALHDAISPSKNVAIGDSAMRVMNGTANGIANCVAIGANAFYGDATNTTIDTNGTVAIGFDSLKLLQTGQANTAIGYKTLDAELNGDKSTAVGYSALSAQAGTTGTVGNTAIGFEAGSNITTGIENTIVGAFSTISAVGGQNQIVIGNGITGEGNNKAVIGNSSITDVYMAKDSGATVHCASVALAGGILTLSADTELAISSGAVTATKNYHTLDTEGGAGTDDLDTINGGSDGQLLILRDDADGRDVTAKDGTGNLALEGDFTFTNSVDTLTLLYCAGKSKWLEISRSNNA